MEIGLVVLSAALAVAVVVAMSYERELKRVAAFLDDRDSASNARLPLGVPLPGTLALTNAVNRQLDGAQALLRRQQEEELEFQQGIVTLSHDIRTPLAGARGYVQLAEDDLAAAEASSCGGLADGSAAAPLRAGNESAPKPPVGVSAEGTVHFLLLADERLRVMQEMLDQLFDYTRSLNPEAYEERNQVDVLSIVASVLAENYPSFSAKGWELQVDFDQDVLLANANREALRRAFDNVVANMLSHGSGEPLVRQSGSRVVFENRAANLEDIQVERLFERFYRGDASRSQSGAGLGLAIVKNLCKPQNVKVTAEVKGDIFSVTFDFRDRVPFGGPLPPSSG